MMRWHGELPYPFDVVVRAFCDMEIRKKWDKGFDGLKEIMETKKDGNLTVDMMYIYIKMPLFISDRDIIQIRKTWLPYTTNPRSVLIQMKSGDHPKYPVKEKPVRVKIIISGYYIEEVNANLTKISSVGRFNMGFPKSMFGMMKKKGPDRVKETLENIKKGCEIVLKSTNKK